MFKNFDAVQVELCAHWPKILPPTVVGSASPGKLLIRKATLKHGSTGALIQTVTVVKQASYLSEPSEK